MNSDAASIRPWGRNTIVRAWRGQEPLWLVYWVYGVIAGFLFNLLLIWLLHLQLAYAVLALLIFFLAYSVWILVAIWRCAANSNVLWRLLARLIVIFNVVWFVYKAIKAFA